MVESVRPGGICAALGFTAAAAACGLKATGEPDVCIIKAEKRCAAAATFTTNAFRAAPILVTGENLAADKHLQAVVVNAGNANAWTGEQGLLDARAMAELTARATGVEPGDVAVASTGVIGRYMDMAKVEAGISEAAARLSEDGSSEAARAIMTTDTHPKETSVFCDGFVVGGMAKGSGMIRPDMATMLAFITTDAAVGPEVLAPALRSAVDRSFNRISIDGCTSTNDMVLVMASGMSGKRPVGAEIEEPLHLVCSELARAIVADGEGATRFVTVRAHEAVSDGEAWRAAMAIAESPLLKTAVFGGDPNWGRVVQALGQAVKDADPSKVRVLIGGMLAAEAGAPSRAGAAELAGAMTGREVAIDVFLGRGEGAAEVWTCDFSYDYVKINAEYST
ncbi:MAG: bifunctional glutamate N-acetyltransferase/amino-acid acetyltransferase ArgJ [Actinomycetota bacterium]